MDNDEYRRGELTVWKKFWEDTAILVWDFLNSLSFELLAEIWNIELIKYFWKSVWIKWMIWGQVLDLYYEKNFKNLNLEQLIEIHNKKTWALIEFSIVWAIILAWYKEENLKEYKNFAQEIWFLFQIKDDLLDIEWTFQETWKSVWWEKKWFVYFLWLEKTKKFSENIIMELRNMQKKLNSKKIDFLINYIKNRKK
jgi:geranylgeranyl pyrophosphate synthase